VFILSPDGVNGRTADFVSGANGAFTGTYDTTQDTIGTYATLVSCQTTNPATNAVGSPFTVTAPPPAPASTYHPLTPARVLDTRNGTGVPGGFTGQLGTASTLDLTLAGVAGVPANATAVVLNFAVADSPGPPSYLTIYPQGTARPLASNLNWQADQTKSLLVIARVANGKVTIYNNLGSTNVIADVQGWFTQG